MSVDKWLLSLAILMAMGALGRGDSNTPVSPQPSIFQADAPSAVTDSDNNAQAVKGQVVDAVEVDTVDANTVDANAVDANTVDANTVDANAVDANAVDANAVDANAVDANAVDANTVDANTVDANTVDANTVEANTVDANTVEAKRVEAKERVDTVLEKTYRKAMVIDVRGPIFGSLQQYLHGRLKAAERGGVDLLILRITSPGGELEASLELARRLSEIQWATTIAFVPEEAYSGAAIVALGCDRIYLRPRALIGDAGPIHFHGGLFEHADEKVVSALAVAMHQLAAAKGRPGAIAEAMVDRKLVVHAANHKTTGQIAYFTAAESQLPRNQADYQIGDIIPESNQNRFLTVAGTRAVELNLAEGTFDSEQQLMETLHIDQISETRRSWVDQVVYLLNLPLVTGLLLLVALIGMYVEFTIPGISVAALISLTCFALFFWSHALGGTSGWLEVMLFALGVACVGVEIFILPGFGIFGLSGVVMIVLSLVMASQDFVLPQSTEQWNLLRNNLLIVLGAMGCLAVALIVQIAFFDSIPGLGRFRLDRPEESLPGFDQAAGSLVGGSIFDTSLPALGQTGIADSVLRPAGKVRFDQRLVDVVTEGDFLDPGTRVEVVKREGNRVVVRKIGT